MLPVIHIGPLSLPVPPFSMLLAIWLGLTVAEKFSNRHGISADGLYNLVFKSAVIGIIAARLGYILQYPAVFLKTPINIISLNPGLLDVFSGITFGLLGLVILIRRARYTIFSTLDALTPLLAIMAIGLAIGHIGSGQAFGSVTDLPWGIELWGAKRHPTQLYELTAAIIIFLVLSAFLQKSLPAGKTFLIFIILSSAARLFLEGFRGDSRIIIGGLRLEQLAAWLILAAGLFMVDIINRKQILEGGQDG